MLQNKKIIIFFLFSTIVLLIVFFLLLISQNYQCQSCKTTQNQIIRHVCFQETCFEVEIADNDFEREQGLMFREKLDENKGMLFIFEQEGIYPFWMQNTLIPLDIIWLNQEKKVVFINKNTQPCKQIVCSSIDPNQPAQYVLEINGGMAEKINLKIGEQFYFK